MKFLGIFTIFTVLFFGNSKLIELNENNFISLRGTVNSDSVSRWVRDVNLINSNDIYLYIKSPGGSVTQGMAFIQQINALQESGKNIHCIADFAASMAFIIFQSCPHRYILSSSILMQHQMSLELKGNLENLQNYLVFIDEINSVAINKQASRINMTSVDFQNKVMNDWWISGNFALENNLADEIVNVKCEKSLFNTIEEIDINTIFGKIVLEFYSCPIINNPVKINSEINANQKINYYDHIKYFIPDFAMNELRKKNYVASNI